MANSIALAKNYTAMLDEVYKLASLTSILDSDASLARAGANANEILIPKLDMSGLADYSRNSGYVGGDVNLTWETVKFNYDRGRLFQVDTMDNEESIDIAFGRLAGEFIRTKVAPEGDAFTISTIAAKSGATVKKDGALADGDAVLNALLAGMTKMDEDEVPADQRILFITPTLKRAVEQLENYKSKAVFDAVTVVATPQSRMYTAIDLQDGKTLGEEAGHYKKASDASEINFLLVHKPAVLKFNKHTASDIIAPAANQTADAYMQKYRKYGLVDVYENKVAGVYVSTK